MISLNFHSKTDFEIALQLGVDRLTITEPDDTFSGIEEIITNSVITAPFLGFVYIDDYGVKKVAKLEEMNKYSDDMLTRFYDTIVHNKGSDFVQHEPK